MQRLNNWNFRFMTRPIDAGRNHHEGVVYVDDVRFLALQKLQNFPAALVGGNRVLDEREPACPGVLTDFVVRSTVGRNLVPGPFEQFAFLLVDDVLTSRLLIPVVNEQDLHVPAPFRGSRQFPVAAMLTRRHWSGRELLCGR